MFQSLRIGLIKKIIDINEYFVFEKNLRKTYKSLLGNEINTIIDVGANKGQTIDFFKKINPTCLIFAFEPNKTLFQKLESKYSADSKVKIFNMGVSDKLGERNFNQNILDYTSTFETLDLNSTYLHTKAKYLGVKPEEVVVKTYPVQTTTLSHFITNHVKQSVDILKIDVEGHEYPCLVGLFDAAISIEIKYIQLEQHNDDMYTNKIPFSEITKLLNSKGFEIKATIKHGFGDFEEVVFYNTKLKG